MDWRVITMRENFMPIFKFLTAVLGILLLISPFLFTSKGLVSRRTLLITYICFVFFATSLWVTAVLTYPSVAILPSIICVSAVIILAGTVFAIKYFTLPIYKKFLDKMTEEHKKQE